MPRFHFNVYDGAASLDADGAEYPDWEAARLNAVRLAGEAFREDPARVTDRETWSMEVTDDRGMILFRLDFSVIESSAIRRVWTTDHEAAHPPPRD